MVGRVKIKIRKRKKIYWFQQLFHILESEEHHDSLPENVPNKHIFFGLVVAKRKSKNSWNVVLIGEDEKVIADVVLLD